MTFISLPNPESLYISSFRNGVDTEGRSTRKGSSSMKIGAMTKNWEVSNVQWITMMVDEMPSPVRAISYRVKLTSFPPISLVKDFKRADTLGFWYFSYQEELRHLQLATRFTSSQYWKGITEVFESSRDKIWDSLLEFYDGIANEGDFSFAHWTEYVKSHVGSTSPWEELNWNDILNSASLMKISHGVCTDWVREYNKWAHRNKPTTIRVIDAKWLYPGVRAREPDYQILRKGNFEMELYATKWRDRKVGGVMGLSQLTWPIYHTDIKKKLVRKLHQRLSEISGITVEGLEETGPVLYKELAENPSLWYTYDLKTAEKQTGLQFVGYGIAADLSAPGYAPEMGPEMYSGLGITSYPNEFEAIISGKVIGEVTGRKPTKAKVFSDNIVFDTKLEDNPHLDTTPAFCGFMKDDKKFGPVSFVTDNPKNRLPFNGYHQLQVQTVQYIMRPLLSVIMNSLDNPNTCKQFIDWIVAAKLNVDPEGDGARSDVIKDFIENLDNIELHKKIMDSFPGAVEFVKEWWRGGLQSTDSQYVSDLKWSN